MKLISVVTNCYNEKENIKELYDEVKKVFALFPRYDYEHIFVDNASTDGTLEILRGIATLDKNVKVIINARNFGYIRSSCYGLFQASGDAVVLMVADLQDPPSLIAKFIEKWEEGHKITIGVKNKSEENPIMVSMRNLYYRMIEKISEAGHVRNYTGYGLYDREVINILKQFNDPYPYLRGAIVEIGFEIFKIEYIQPKRKKGKTTTNLYVLYNMAMLGFVNLSMVPLRIAVFVGFGTALISLLFAFGYFIYKIIYLRELQLGIAPVAIGLFFFSSVQLFFTGIIGEYIGAIYTQVRKRPLVIEKERINF